MPKGNCLKTVLARLRSLEERVYSVPMTSVQQELLEVINLVQQIEELKERDESVRTRLLAVLGFLLVKYPDIENLIKRLFDD